MERGRRGDLALPGVEGPRTAATTAITCYVARLHAAAAHDARPADAFVRVAGLVDRPERLLRPAVALRVLRGARRVADPAPAPAARDITPPRASPR